MKWISCTLVFLSFTLCHAQDISTRPGPKDQVTEIMVTLVVMDISEVNTNQQQFSANIFLKARWQDDRLKYEKGANQKVKKLTFQQAWHPNLEIINRREASETLPKELRVSPSGEVIYIQRYLGNFSQPLALHDFPLDQQKLQIQLISIGYDAHEVKLIQDPEMNILKGLEKFSLPDWNISDISSTTQAKQVIQTIPAHNLYLLNVLVQRKIGYYILKVIIPFLLVVMMSWAIFWMSPKSAEAQLQITITSMLTVIAFQFAISQILPEVSYMTRMDQFIMVSTFLVFFSITEALYTAICNARNQTEKALKIDYYSRILFPLIFFTAGLYIFFH